LSRLLYGDRIGRNAELRVGAGGIVFDPTETRVLLTRREDNGRWCLPGGAMDPGESAMEAAVRELREETGLDTRVVRLIGVYSDPHHIMEYADGNRVHVLALQFEMEIVGGELGLSDETLDAGFFTRDEMRGMDIMEPHLERIEDAFARRDAAFIR
jgi:8-oxo-dGTP pyrophosphatase MutT (NUDIX family)